MGNAIMKCFCLQPVSNPVHDKEVRANIDAFMAAYKNGNLNESESESENGNTHLKTS